MKADSRCARGFSLVEILVVIAVVGILATVAIPVVTGVPDAAKKDKLEQDVVVVNNAIDSYLAAGGAAANLTAANVLTVLKSRVYGGMPAEMMGPQGPFLDPTVVTNRTDFQWSARFTTNPPSSSSTNNNARRPRFVVEKSTEGVVFGRGPAMAIGGVAERPDEARPSWLWSYAEATPPPQVGGFTPLAVDEGFAFTNPSTSISNLGPPVLSPGSLTNTLGGFPVSVVINNTNTNSPSRIYYRSGSGGYTLYDGAPISVGPGTTLTALCVSLDPSRFRNSPETNGFYGVIPLQLAVKVTAPSSVTYAEAGGLMQGIGQLQSARVLITLEDTNNMLEGAADNLLLLETNRPDDRFIPAQYLNNLNFTIRYTTDGSDPATNGVSGPSFSGFFSPVIVNLGLAVWTNTSVVVRAIAIAATNAPMFQSMSNAASATSSIRATDLPVEIIPANPIGLPDVLQLRLAVPVPVGVRTYYTINEDPPLTSESGGLVRTTPIPTLYVGPFAGPTVAYNLNAQATGPAGSERWFSSPANEAQYAPIRVLDPKLVGANISGGDVNGSFVGSIFVSAPANLGIFNAGGTVTRGNLYLPGLPEIEVTGQQGGTTIVAQGVTNYSGSPPVPRSIIAGKEYTATGQLADPQLDTRQIVTQGGGTYTNPYTVKITTSTFIEGKIFRNVDVPTNTVTPPNRTATNRITGNFDGLSSNTVPLASGFYSNNITLDKTNAVLRLGSLTSNTNEVTQYIFRDVNWSKGRIEIIGRVQIIFDTGFVNSGVIIGSSNTVDQLSVFVTAADADVEFKSGGQFFGNLWLTNGTPPKRNDVTVGNDSALYGSVTAQYLTVAPRGVVNVE
jgi:prepilin-type N-terminal cleavage/methylation domain-containing protein